MVLSLAPGSGLRMSLTLVPLRDTEAFLILLRDLHRSLIKTVPSEEQFSKKALTPFRGYLGMCKCIFGYHNDKGAIGLLLRAARRLSV